MTRRMKGEQGGDALAHADDAQVQAWIVGSSLPLTGAEVNKIFFVVQKYSNQGISCKFIQIRVFRAEILVRHRYALPYVAQMNFLDQTKPNQTASACTEKWQMAVEGL